MQSEFQNTNPERGRKLLRHPLTRGKWAFISEHEPRKGTETCLGLATIFHFANFDFRTRTPKGDGNTRYLPLVNHFFVRFQNTNPERGRKRPVRQNLSTRCLCISEHEPRKGTETANLSTIARRAASISEHEPRKGTETNDKGRRLDICLIVFQNTNPERGRKHCHSYICVLVYNFRTRTPKGDGNGCSWLLYSHTTPPFQNTNPGRGRK